MAWILEALVTEMRNPLTVYNPPIRLSYKFGTEALCQAAFQTLQTDWGLNGTPDRPLDGCMSMIHLSD